MPIPLLIALVLAFGFGEQGGDGPLPADQARWNLTLVGGGVLGLGLVLALLSGLLQQQARRPGSSYFRLRRGTRLLGRLTDVACLGLFALALYQLEWARVVRWNLGLRNWIVLDELVQILPFLTAQVLGWWALYGAERAVLGTPSSTPALSKHLGLKLRQALGLVLPMALIYGVGRDLLQRVLPGGGQDPIGQITSMALMGGLVLMLSPLFVRLSWPTRPLPPGPLRDRLERLARRLNFRCTDILVWDTGGNLVNAGVTGTLPMFRYVLLTDAMVELVAPEQIEAIFGHEVGHVAHRHLTYFGFFFVGSLMLMILLELGIRTGLEGWSPAWLGGPTGIEIAEWVLALLGVALYFGFVFGYLSRRFERQADLYGCRAVSCTDTTCPPHTDPVAPLADGTAPRPVAVPVGPCPTGIRIFAAALAEVALLNGLRPEAFSWRHGSIARRIAFVESLTGRPEAARQFQTRLRRFRLALGLTLVAAALTVLWLAQRIEGLL